MAASVTILGVHPVPLSPRVTQLVTGDRGVALPGRRTKDLHMGGQTSDLVELIIRRVNGGSTQPDPLIAELERHGSARRPLDQ